MINVKLSTNATDQQIKNAILDSVAKELSKVFQKAIPAIKDRIQTVCELLLLQSPVFENLISGGELLGDLGIPDVNARIKAIISAVQNSVQVIYQPIVRRGSDLSGGIAINILKSDFSEILSIAAASYPTEKGVSIEWLDWLLLQGDKIIVIGYDVIPAVNPAQRQISRTGLALMRNGSGFRIPPQFAGTKENNFITNAFNIPEVTHLLKIILEEEINSRIT